MTSNDKFDVDMTDAINQQENAKKKKKDNIEKMVETHLGEKVQQPIPYLFQGQSASSSSAQPIIVDKSESVKRKDDAEDTSKRRGRPSKNQKPNDGTENTTQPRGRPKSQSVPMMVDKEGDSKKRPKSANPDSPSKTRAKAKSKMTKEELPNALLNLEQKTPKAKQPPAPAPEPK